MGNLDSSMGFSVNEDGSITRINCSLQNNQTPDFIPATISKFKGGFGKKVLYILCYLILLFANGMSIIGLVVRLVYESDPLIIVTLPIVASLILDFFVGIPLIKSYPNKKHILKCAEYVQANLNFNYGYPYIMTHNHIGVLNTHIKKVIIPPEYDVIYWVIPQNVLCAVKDDKQIFYDVNGKILANVPDSYYTQNSMI